MRESEERVAGSEDISSEISIPGGSLQALHCKTPQFEHF
jgi:hypothetical protein